MRTTAFTLVELLTVIAIVALLSAIIFPVFAIVQGRARASTCQSNLRQIGIATLAYAQDYDDRFPLGGDPLDINVPRSWVGSPFESVVKELKPLPVVLNPYIKSKTIWQCPADSGFERGARSENILFDTRPSSFDKYGSSYYYFTSLVLHNDTVAALHAWSKTSPHEERGPAQIVLLYDGTGRWHGGVLGSRRYMSLFVDGHAKMLPDDEFNSAFELIWKKP